MVPKCPSCGVALPPTAENKFRPFCSHRCKLVDLDHWLSGDYRIPGPPVDPEAIVDETIRDPRRAMPRQGEA